jgi:hypothetical protein
MTSVTTLLALMALFVLGGDVIRGFVFAMIWGVIVGDMVVGVRGGCGGQAAGREARLVQEWR